MRVVVDWDEWYGGEFSVELISHRELSLPAYQETDGDEHDDCGGFWWMFNVLKLFA